jgi:diguanylate cyclase (GGDEF)-like protein/PAS domain S-box-containing protein
MNRLIARFRTYRPSPHNLIILFVALACMIGVALEGWPIWRSRTIAITLDKTETSNLASSLAQHTHDAIETADTALIGLREALEVAGMQQALPDRMFRLMTNYVQDRPQLHGMFVYDAAGNWVVNSHSITPASSLNNADRAYFQYHRDHPNRQVHVDTLVRSKSDGEWILPVSRRIDNPDGSFAGVVLATVSAKFFQDFYQSFDPGSGGIIGLLSAQGILAARNPIDEQAIGADLSKGPVFSQFAGSSIADTFRYRSPIDGIERFGSVHRVPGFPLVVIVSHSAIEILADWWSDVLRYLTIACMALAALIVLGIRMAQQIKRRAKVEQHYRLLADHSSDAIVAATLGGQRTYVSPSFVALTGWTVKESLRLPWVTMVDPADRPLLEEAIALIRNGSPPITVRYRYVRKNGTLLWVEALIRMAPSPDDAEGQLVANIRDITTRKAAEDEIAALNRELAAQATTDGLTGLANRRSFDAQLEHEWQRARRQGTTLSLLMIDVDHFKLYNDEYGHQAGDVCLRGVAQQVSDAMCRSTDIVARYGGEEIVVILPDTDTVGAGEIAERVRYAIEAARVPHRRNLPSGSVTASIGAATADMAQSPQTGVATLITAADCALYAAKRAGRNRVGHAGEAPRSVLACR